MRGAKFSLLDSMLGAKSTICKAIDMLKIDCFARKNQFTGALLAFHANIGCMAEYFTTAGYFYKTSTSAIKFVSRQPNTVDSFRSFALACTDMEMLKRGWYHIHSHQHCPSSVLRLSAPQSVSVYKLYSLPPCIVLNLCFSFRPGISHSLGFDPVTDVLPARASRCSSACQQLEKGAVTKHVPPLLPAASTTMRCVTAAQGETAILI